MTIFHLTIWRHQTEMIKQNERKIKNRSKNTRTRDWENSLKRSALCWVMKCFNHQIVTLQRLMLCKWDSCSCVLHIIIFDVVGVLCCAILLVSLFPYRWTSYHIVTDIIVISIAIINGLLLLMIHFSRFNLDIQSLCNWVS